MIYFPSYMWYTPGMTLDERWELVYPHHGLPNSTVT